MQARRQLVCSEKNVAYLQSQLKHYFHKATGHSLQPQGNLTNTLIHFIESSEHLVRWGEEESIHVFNYMFLYKIVPEMVKEWEARKVERYNQSSYLSDIESQDFSKFNRNTELERVNTRRAQDTPFPEISDNIRGQNVKRNSRFFES